jgi:transposase-like protein
VISVDEKTGIQAIERHEARAPISKGGHLRKEYEYERNGTTTLIAAIKVENGELFNHTLGPTRTEEDYTKFMKKTISKLPEEDKVVVLSDQLNTHISESLVRWIAEMEEYDAVELGVKGRLGFLKNIETRKAFLEQDSHRVQFLFTPKHCSWLNPIENWFAKVQRHVIKNGNFASVEKLEQKIEAYINFYNDCLSKPLKWKFRGFYKNKKLLNLICQ